MTKSAAVCCTGCLRQSTPQPQTAGRGCCKSNRSADCLDVWQSLSMSSSYLQEFFDSLCPARQQLSVPLAHLVQLPSPHKRAVPASCVLAPAAALLFSLLSTSSVQVALAKPIITLLSKEYHARQMHQRPNVVQVGACVLGMRRCGLDLEGCTAKC